MSKLVYFIIPFGMLFSGIALINLQGENQLQPDMRSMSEQMTVIASESPAIGLHFCDQQVPLEVYSIKARLDKELHRLIFSPGSADLLHSRALQYRSAFEQILSEYGVPKDMFYLAIAESNLSNATSPVGAQGFWQFMEATGRQYRLEISETVDERFHPYKATRAAARYMRDIYKQFGDWALVAAAYNMGQNRLARVLRQQETDSYYRLNLNRETSRYVFKVLSFKSILENPGRYGLHLRKTKSHKPIPTYSVRVRENIADLATFAIENGTTYQMLKLLNPWLISDHLEAKAGKTYEIRLPLVDNIHAPELKTNLWAEEYRKLDSIRQALPVQQVNDTIPAPTE